MKKSFALFGCLLLLFPAVCLAADCNVPNDKATLALALADDDCATVTLAESEVLEGDGMLIVDRSVEIMGDSGTESISGTIENNDPLILVLTDNDDIVKIHDLQLSNSYTSNFASAISINTGHLIEIYNITFQDCPDSCINLVSGSGIFYNNTFENMSAIPDKTILYNDDEFSLEPTLGSASIADAENWQIEVTPPDGETGTIHLYYVADGGTDIIPIDVEYTDKSEAFNTTIPFTTQIPNNITVYATFTPDGESTSQLSSPITADWSSEDFSWGDYEACNTAWFADSTNGQWAGDFDGDGLTNTEEDANQNCIVDAGETTPELDNAAPSAPELVTPADGATDVDLDTTLTWNSSTDIDTDDELTYNIYICTNADFTDCDGIEVSASLLYPINAKYALGLAGLAFLGGISRNGRKKMFLLAALAIVTFGAFSSCGGGGGAPAVTEGDTSYSPATALEANTTYYWKVTVSDGHNGNVVSGTEPWSFTTTE